MMMKLLLVTLLSTDHPVLSDAHLEELIRHQGKIISIRTNEGLGEALYWANLVPMEATQIAITETLIRDVVAVRAFLQRTRYRAGDRIIVRSTRGGLTPRAEISAANADGTYDVNVWDKLTSVKWPDLDAEATRAIIDIDTGELKNPGLTTVEVKDPATGRVKTVKMKRPWLERPNLRTVRMTHAEIDALNGPPDVGFRQRYNLFGYVIDPFAPGYDPVLQGRVAEAMAYVDKLASEGKLDLRWPSNPAERPKFLESLVDVQRQIIRKVWAQNSMRYLRGTEETRRWNEAMADPTLKDGHAHKIGAQLKARVGVCSDQTAGITSVLREVGRRAGFEIRPVSGSTLDGGGHAFAVIRLADGKLHLIDPSWHSVSQKTSSIALESIDFATFDKRWWSNRDLGSFVEQSVQTPRSVGRGYTDVHDALFRAGAQGGLADLAARPIQRNWMERVMDRFEVYESEGAARARGPLVWMADPIGDPKLVQALDLLEKHGEGRIAELVRSGKVDVRWSDGRILSTSEGRGAAAVVNRVFLNPDHDVRTLAVELMHEAAHAEGYLRTGKPASEPQAFRAEAAFAKRAGLSSALPADLIERMTDAEIEREIVRRWPKLYGDGEARRAAWATEHGHRSRLTNVTKSIGRGAVGAGTFAAGFVVKETIQGIAEGDAGRIRGAVGALKDPWFAGGFAVFAGAEAATSKLLGTPKGMWGSTARFALPLYAGVSILHVAQGKRDVKSIASEATSFGVAALALQPVMHAVRGALYPALAASGPVGWAGIGAIEVANAATMLWGAEKIAPVVDRTIAGAGALGKKTVSAISKLKFW